MNEQLLNQLIEQAMGDEGFRQTLLSDPKSVLSEWGFAPDEVAQLETRLDQGISLEDLDERISKYLFGGGGPGG